MKVEDFFDNLAVFFKNEDDLSTDGLVSIYRNEDGQVTEIRIFNPEYEEFLIIDRERNFEVINVAEFNESLMKNMVKKETTKAPFKKPRKAKS